MREQKYLNPTRLTELSGLNYYILFVSLFYTKLDYSKLYKYVDLEANWRVMYKFPQKVFEIQHAC